MPWLRSLATFAVLAAALLLCAEDADARLEGGLSSGKSVRTFVSPPAAAIGMTAALDHPATGQSGYAGGSLGGLFNRPGLLGGFAAGFLGAGLLGLFFGHGLFGGLGGVTSYLGLIFQLALVAMLGRVIWTWWNGRNAPAFAGLSPRQQAEPYLRSRHEMLPDIRAAASDDVAASEGAAKPSNGVEHESK